MFYSSQLLSRKTPLGICWLASHSESKRLKRAQVFDFSISQSCDSIINPEAPLALRLSGQLLLGVVRIYQRKLVFLETDAKNAIDGLQRKDVASQNVDLPDGGTAPETAITLPDSDQAFFAGSDLFPSFNVSATPGLGTGGTSSLARLSAGTESLTMADDISDVFGSTRWTGSDDRFDLVGTSNIDQQFSTELERLRSQAAVETPRDDGNVFYDAPDDYGPMDDMMDAPNAGYFDAPDMEIGKTPGSVGGKFGDLAATSLDFGISPGMVLPDVLTPGTEGPPHAPDTPATTSKKKKKKVHIDIDTAGNPLLQLEDAEMKRLQRNRAPLMKKRGVNVEHDEAGGATSGMHHAFELFDRPACLNHTSHEIESLIKNAFDLKQAKITVQKSSKNKDVQDVEEEATPLPAARNDNNDDDMPIYDDGGYEEYGGYDADYPEAALEAGDTLNSGDMAMATPDADRDIEEGIMAHDGFTARTKSVLKVLQKRFEPSPGNKRSRQSAEGTSNTLELDSIVQGKSRLEACRWFFESLVLRNKGFVDLEQSEPYGTITIRPMPGSTTGIVSGST